MFLGIGPWHGQDYKICKWKFLDFIFWYKILSQNTRIIKYRVWRKHKDQLFQPLMMITLYLKCWIKITTYTRDFNVIAATRRTYRGSEFTFHLPYPFFRIPWEEFRIPWEELYLSVRNTQFAPYSSSGDTLIQNNVVLKYPVQLSF